jgi:hypothetical protein
MAALTRLWWSSRGRLFRRDLLDRILRHRRTIHTYHMGHMDIGVAAGTAGTIGGEASTGIGTVGARSAEATSAIYEVANSGATGLAVRAVSMSEVS